LFCRVGTRSNCWAGALAKWAGGARPKPLETLRSDITLREMGEKLDISISQAFRLKDRAREQ
jgi:hypothetical protein